MKFENGDPAFDNFANKPVPNALFRFVFPRIERPIWPVTNEIGTAMFLYLAEVPRKKLVEPLSNIIGNYAYNLGNVVDGYFITYCLNGLGRVVFPDMPKEVKTAWNIGSVIVASTFIATLEYGIIQVGINRPDRNDVYAGVAGAIWEGINHQVTINTQADSKISK